MLEELLLKLCTAMRDDTLKSKQACFDYFLSDLIEAKKTHSWKNITDFLNKETGRELSIDTYRYMFKKAKGRTSVNARKDAEKSLPIKPQTRENLEEKRTKIPEQIVHDANSIATYMQVCFGSERLAIRAINADVAIETIRSWKCPNVINLGTTLSNHIQLL